MHKNFLFLICLFALVLFAASCTHKNLPYGNNPKVGKYCSIRGMKMYYEVYGNDNGKPLLMIHGNDGSISTFTYNIPHFLDDYKVILVDARGQGKSVDRKDSITFEMMADDYAALLDSIHIDSVNVLGWSDGGISGLLLAIRHPEKVKNLAISGTNLWPDTSAIMPTDWKADYNNYKTLQQKSKKTKDEIRKLKMLKLDLTEPHINVNELKKVKCPTMVICGDHDMIKLAHTELIFENIKRSHLWVIPNSSHYTLMEHRRIFDLRVDDFFSKQFNDDNLNLLEYYN